MCKFKSLVSISIAAFLLMFPLTSNATLDMDCYKTQYGTTPTLECTFTWSAFDELIWWRGKMTSDVWRTTVPYAHHQGLDYFYAEDQPDNKRQHIVQWEIAGIFLLESEGWLYFPLGWPASGNVYPPQISAEYGVYDAVTAPLP